MTNKGFPELQTVVPIAPFFIWRSNWNHLDLRLNPSCLFLLCVPGLGCGNPDICKMAPKACRKLTLYDMVGVRFNNCDCLNTFLYAVFTAAFLALWKITFYSYPV